ncbi:Protein mesA [Durusdinium trenchii]|uniref:DENN domain-containing protein 11 n=1 Tax=Durusdinium trenchii TaxID=1381693 RepID=A0ABP0J110_9DINO
MANKRLVHSVSGTLDLFGATGRWWAELREKENSFDELKGNTLSYVFPENPQPEITSHQKEDIAELCLPDGGHKHSSDSIFLLLTGKDNVQLYGFAYFRNRKSASEKRGAKQLALLIVATSPYFDRFRPFLTVAIEEYLDQNESKVVIHELYDALEKSYRRTKRLAENRLRSSWSANMQIESDEEDFEDQDDHDAHDESRTAAFLGRTERGQKSGRQLENNGLLTGSCTYTMQIWGRMFVMQPLKPLQKNEFGGVSLKDFALKFRAQTMTLWTALLSMKRVLICGPESQADDVGQFVLATPLLMGPLGMLIIPNLVPYVTLANVDPVTKHSSFVCGTTNGLFATKEQWYDLVADPKTGKVVSSPQSNMDRSLLKVTGHDLAFINRVLDGIENGKREEDWVRFEFATYTQDFLDTVREIESERISKRSTVNLTSVNKAAAPLHHKNHSEDITHSHTHTTGIFSRSIMKTSPSRRLQLQHQQPSIRDTVGASTPAEASNGQDQSQPKETPPPPPPPLPPSSRHQSAVSGDLVDMVKKRKTIPKWQRKKVRTPFLKRKNKTASDKVALTFAGTPLWLRYRWMQLNPESFTPRRCQQQLSRVHAIELKDEEVTAAPPALPKRPSGWKEDEDAAEIDHRMQHLSLSEHALRSAKSEHDLAVRHRLSRQAESSSSTPEPCHGGSVGGYQGLVEDTASGPGNSGKSFNTFISGPSYQSGISDCSEQAEEEESPEQDDESRIEYGSGKSIGGSNDEDEGDGGDGDDDDDDDDDSNWREATTADGRTYFWNIKTMKTKWSLGPGAVPPRHSTASTASGTSGNSAPDKVNIASVRPVEDVIEAQQDLEPQLAEQQDPSFGEDCDSTGSNPNATKWVMLKGRWQRVSVLVAEDTTNKQFKKTDWVEARTDAGKTYYWNVTTGETRWNVPADFEAPAIA